MGEESIIFLAFQKFIGMGINWGYCQNAYYIIINLPFLLFRFSFKKKTEDNSWFDFQNQLHMDY